MSKKSSKQKRAEVIEYEEDFKKTNKSVFEKLIGSDDRLVVDGPPYIYFNLVFGRIVDLNKMNDDDWKKICDILEIETKYDPEDGEGYDDGDVIPYKEYFDLDDDSYEKTKNYWHSPVDDAGDIRIEGFDININMKLIPIKMWRKMARSWQKNHIPTRLHDIKYGRSPMNIIYNFYINHPTFKNFDKNLHLRNPLSDVTDPYVQTFENRNSDYDFFLIPGGF